MWHTQLNDSPEAAAGLCYTLCRVNGTGTLHHLLSQWVFPHYLPPPFFFFFIHLEMALIHDATMWLVAVSSWAFPCRFIPAGG